jgi:hypothetical protein
MLLGMPLIPPELLPVLAGLGITDPAANRWERRDPCPIKYMRSHYYCPCGTRPEGQQRVELRYTVLAGRQIFIGQCPWCRTVYWKEAERE